MSKFKIGDRVYCPSLGTGVYTLDISLSGDDFIVRADISKYHYVNEDGRLFSSDLLPHIFHVTEENREKLEALYGLEFEKPKRKLKGSELCKRLLKTNPHVLCFVSDDNDDKAFIGKIAMVISRSRSDCNYFRPLAGPSWNYAVPIDLETLEPLEMEVGDE